MAKWLLLNDIKGRRAGETFDDVQMRGGAAFIQSLQASGGVLVEATAGSLYEQVATELGLDRNIGRVTAQEIQARLLARLIAGLPIDQDEQNFGSGTDGPHPGGVLTLTRDMELTDWIWKPGDQLIAGRFNVAFSGTCSVENAPAGTIERAPVNGNNGAAGGAGGASATSIQAIGDTLGSSGSSLAGGAGQNAAGSQAAAPVGQTNLLGGAAAANGIAGGAGSGGAGGIVRASNAYLGFGSNLLRALPYPPIAMVASNNSATAGIPCGGQTGASGGGGGGDGAAPGGGAGSAGLGGALGWLRARRFAWNKQTAAGVIRFLGGKGGNGGSPVGSNKGGGAPGLGGGGGAFYALLGTAIGPELIDLIICDGGAGGDGGNGSGTGAGAAGADGGSGGQIIVGIVGSNPNVWRRVIGGIGGAGNPAVGAAGGVGGIGGLCRMTLTGATA